VSSAVTRTFSSGFHVQSPFHNVPIVFSVDLLVIKDLLNFEFGFLVVVFFAGYRGDCSGFRGIYFFSLSVANMLCFRLADGKFSVQFPVCLWI
jgi:hypothetical protein